MPDRQAVAAAILKVREGGRTELVDLKGWARVKLFEEADAAIAAYEASRGEEARQGPTDAERAKIEQEFENDAVRRMQKTGYCPLCGAES